MASKTQIAKRFLTIFNQLVCPDPKTKVLLALSGGMDSVVLFDLLLAHKVNFEVAHCNFQLRGEESDKDAVFVSALCKTHGIQLHLRKFETIAQAHGNGISIEMAARELRYHWFQELIDEFSLDFLLTAHHAADNFETALLNLTKGTGIAGLKGISSRIGKTVRPLLSFSKEELKTYAIERKLKWREDESNKSNEFQRNLLRNKVLPLLKEINPNVDRTFTNSSWRIALWFDLLNEKVDTFAKKYLKGKHWEVPFQVLTDLEARAVLVEFLANKGFEINTIRDFVEKEQHKVGSLFASQEMELIGERGYFVLRNKEEIKLVNTEIDFNSKIELAANQHLSLIEFSDKPDFSDPYRVYFEEEKLQFPLQVRTWQHGDKIQAFGMKGKKLVSDILIDKKIPNSEKGKVLVLLNKGEIVWILGITTSEKYRLQSSFKALVEAKYKV